MSPTQRTKKGVVDSSRQGIRDRRADPGPFEEEKDIFLKSCVELQFVPLKLASIIALPRVRFRSVARYAGLFTHSTCDTGLRRLALG